MALVEQFDQIRQFLVLRVVEGRLPLVVLDGLVCTGLEQGFHGYLVTLPNREM